MLKDRFSTREVLDLTGTTARQLQWWDERRIVVPEREGRNRVYSAADLIEIHVIEQLRVRHISLARVRQVLRFLRRELKVRLADVVAGKTEHHLLLDGRALYLETDARQIVDLIRNTTQPVFVICLTDAVRRLQMTAEDLVEGGAQIRKPVTRSASNGEKEERRRTRA